VTVRLLLLLTALAAMQVSAQQALDVVHVRGNLYMIAGPNGNSTVQFGRDGVLIVDPQPKAMTSAMLQEVAKLSENKPVRFLINTNGDADRVSGNEGAGSAGKALAGGNTRPNVVYSSGGAAIWASQNVLDRLTREAVIPSTAWPTDTYFVQQKDMFVNGEPVQLLHAAAAHSDGDTLVVFRRTDAISVGDVFTPDRYPVIDLQHGGSIDGLIAAINEVLRITVPEFNEEGGTLVIPGHGRLSDEADVAEYRDMVTIVRDRIRDLVKKGMTLEQVKASKPTLEYDSIYGADKGAVFIEQVYRSLSK
jgi:glyoxylase-like metal-dependent hydrolase (beta-lactamase superfamily II)